MQPTVITIAQATDAHPRQSESAMFQRTDGTLIIAWQEYIAGERGSEDDAPNHLATMRSRDGGMTWSDKQILIEPDEGDISIYSPSFVRLPGGDVLLTYHQYHQIERGKPPRTSGFARVSDDDGDTWSDRIAVWRDKPFGGASGVTKQTASGRLIWPIDRQMGRVWADDDRSAVGAMISDDQGNTWRCGEQWIELPMRGAMEPHLESLADGRLLMVMRTQLGSVFESISEDDGLTWSGPQPMPLVAPESCPELVRIASTGDLCLIFNGARYEATWTGRTPIGSHYGPRTPLTSVIGRDEGRTWTHRRDIVADPRYCYSNPVAFFTREKTCIVTWFGCPYNDKWRLEDKYIHLEAAVLPVDWFYGK